MRSNHSRQAVATTALLSAVLGAALLLHMGNAPAARAVDGNSDVDAVFVSWESSRMCPGDPTGLFSDGCHRITPKEEYSRDVALGLVNDDAFLDAVFAGGANLVCLGDRHGSISDDCYVVDDGIEPHRPASAVALGYVNDDDHLDVVYAVEYASNRVCIGDGAAIPRFACTDLSPNTTRSSGIALGHVDGDPHLDVVVANVFGGDAHGSQICLGDGHGAFGCSELAASYFEAADVELGFVNDDASLDAVFAGGGLAPGPNQVCLGDGSGGFACSAVDTDAVRSAGVALGLIDGDDHLDAVFSRYPDWGQFCFGRGDGTFDCSADDRLRAAGWDVALGMVNDDEHIDAVFSFSASKLVSGNRVCLGDGSGKFSCWMGATDAPSSISVALSPKRGTVVIEKVTEPRGAREAFSFVTTLGAEFALSDGQEQALRNLVPNALSTTRRRYAVTEQSDTDGVTLIDIECDDADSANPSTGDLTTRTATISLDPGETVTCTFTSRDDRPAQPTPGDATTVPPGPGSVTGFSGSAEGLTVTLNWETDVEPDVVGFSVYRSTSPGGSYRRVNLDQIRSRGSAKRGARYRLEDHPGVGTYQYRLEMRHTMWSARYGPATVNVDGGTCLLPLLARRP